MRNFCVEEIPPGDPGAGGCWFFDSIISGIGDFFSGGGGGDVVTLDPETQAAIDSGSLGPGLTAVDAQIPQPDPGLPSDLSGGDPFPISGGDSRSFLSGLSLTPGEALLGASGINALTGLISGANTAGAVTDAAKLQANAANRATTASQSTFNTIRQDLLPFIGLGEGAAGQLAGLTGTLPGGNPLTAALTAPFAPTEAQLASTPGYQFTLAQGQQATQNAFTAQGLGGGPVGTTNNSGGLSGPAAKGIAQFTTGLADTTFNQQLDNYLRQNLQIAGILQGQIGIGANAATQSGNLAVTGQNITNNLQTSGAASTAAGQVGAANAIGGALSSVGTSAANAATILALTQPGGIFSNSQRSGSNPLQQPRTDAQGNPLPS